MKELLPLIYGAVGLVAAALVLVVILAVAAKVWKR